MLIYLILAFEIYRIEDDIENIGNIIYLVCVGISSLITLIFLLSIFKLLIFHIKLIRKNLTTIEFYEIKDLLKLNPMHVHPYDKGVKANVSEVIP